MQGTSPSTPLQDRVEQHFADSNVRRRDICCDLASALVGIAFVVVAVTATYFMANQYGWSLKMAPVYAGVGLFGVTGAILAFLSIKWMVEGCLKFERNQRTLHNFD